MWNEIISGGINNAHEPTPDQTFHFPGFHLNVFFHRGLFFEVGNHTIKNQRCMNVNYKCDLLTSMEKECSYVEK